MIKVAVHKTGSHFTSMEVSGHAGSGDSGFDLVCAGVSSIMTGALNAFNHFDPNALLNMTSEPLITIELTNHNDLNQKLFEFVLIQLKTVEAAHSNYIRILEKEVTS